MQSRYSAIILDRGLPELDGLTLLKLLRVSGCTVPALFVTDMATAQERVDGLEAGADYLVKPFAVEELIARVKRLCASASPANVIAETNIADLRLDLRNHTVFRGNTEIKVTSREFKLLGFLIALKNTFVSKRMLLEGVWGLNFDPGTSVVQTQISRLKSKLGTAEMNDIIQTLPGGYMLVDAVQIHDH
jgi:two-component system, OmpR family, response regulator